MVRLLASAGILATIAATPSLARPLTPEDIARIEQVAAIAVSPDGTKIAYTSFSRPDVTKGEENDSGRQQLKLATGAGQSRTFLPQDKSVSAVDFTPDGKTITFLYKEEDGKRAVWGIPVDGGAERKLAEIDGADVKGYRVARDGSTIYLLAAPAEDKVREKEEKAGFDSVVFEEEHHFARMFAAKLGDEVDDDPVDIAIPGEVSKFELVPGGKLALIESAPTPLVDDSYTSSTYQLLDLATGKVVRKIGTTGKLEDADVSPDGKSLAMIAAVDANDPAPTTLYLVNLADGAMTPLNAGAAEAATDAEWLDDGRLAVLVDVGVRSELRLYSPAGKLQKTIPGGELILDKLETAGKTLAVVADEPSHPGELYTLDGNTFTRWTSHNPWLAEIDMGKQRAMTYTARDGQVIEGILIEPVGGAPRGGAPTILDVHGGPESHESNGWATGYGNPGQVAAGQGYAVFLPNYRGSTAYGTAFSKQHQYDAAGKEFDDIVDAKRALVAAGIADPKRVGVTGGSYGGFATAWASTAQSEEFAAGVMFVGISNIVSKFGTTDIPKEEYLVHARKYPWEDYEDTLRRSPVYYTDKADTPLLILHGDSDPRVSPTQSKELYRWIKTRRPDTPLRLVYYPGEGHGNAMAAARYDFNLRMMQWFDTYLKTGNRDAALPPSRPILPAEVTGEESEDGED